MKYNYTNPQMEVLSLTALQDKVLCASKGIDPSGSGSDFIWGNGSGTDPNGSGSDFNWGN